MTRGLGPVALALLTIFVGGCASVHETHYFRSQQAGASPNYYRVTIDANARATKVRYLAGYFDEQAVEQYFSEFTQPESLASVTGSQDGGDEGEGDADAQAPSSSARLEPIDPKLEGRSLVLILSTNVDEIAAQIGGMAENIQVQTALAGLAQREQVEASELAQKRDELDEARAEQLARTIEQVQAVLDDDKASAKAKQAARLRVANALATYLGATEPFADLEAAHQWLAENRSRIHAECSQ